MKKVFAINGGAGRVIAALPALQKYYKLNGKNFYILSESGIEFFVGNKELQDLTFSPETKGIFETYIKENDLVTPEPYRDHGYYNQKRSLSEAFDYLINGSTDHSDLERPQVCLSKQEEIHALEALANAKKQFGKEKTIVIQPFGRGSQQVVGQVVDVTSRSLSQQNYISLIENLSKDYNIIYMGEFLEVESISFKIQCTLRQWGAVIEASDYFIGCDSVGQHLAYAFNKPGTVILGSTFAENVSYPKHFQIIQKQPVDIKYSPIRIAEMVDGDLANRYNDTCMDFTEKEFSAIIEKIRSDIKKKT